MFSPWNRWGAIMLGIMGLWSLAIAISGHVSEGTLSLNLANYYGLGVMFVVWAIITAFSKPKLDVDDDV